MVQIDTKVKSRKLSWHFVFLADIYLSMYAWKYPLWDRLATPICLHFWLSGMSEQLTSPALNHFCPSSLPFEWYHFLLTLEVIKITLYKYRYSSIPWLKKISKVVFSSQPFLFNKGLIYCLSINSYQSKVFSRWRVLATLNITWCFLLIFEILFVHG